MRISEENRSRLIRVINAIRYSFNWSKSSKGEEFWKDAVYTIGKLIDYEGPFKNVEHEFYGPSDLEEASKLLDRALIWANTPPSFAYYSTLNRELKNQAKAHASVKDTQKQDDIKYIIRVLTYDLPSTDKNRKAITYLYDMIGVNPLMALRPEKFNTFSPKATERSKIAAKKLFTAFTWRFSEQGHSYWEEFHKKLIELSQPKEEKALSSLSSRDSRKLRVAASSLLHAFEWENSEEGLEFWDTAHDDLVRLTGSDPETYSGMYESPTYRTKAEKYNALKEAHETIKSAFSWSRTQKGYSYWVKVSRALGAVVSSMKPKDTEAVISIDGTRYNLKLSEVA